MNRRSFLGLSSAALAAFTLDPERAIWVPGQRSYFDIVRTYQVIPYITIEYADGTRRCYTNYDPMPSDWYTSIKAKVVMIDQLSYA
jgi:hypothetical protein